MGSRTVSSSNVGFFNSTQAPSVSTRAAISDKSPSVELSHSASSLSEDLVGTPLVSMAMGHQVLDRALSFDTTATIRAVVSLSLSETSRVPERDQSKCASRRLRPFFAFARANRYLLGIWAMV